MNFNAVEEWRAYYIDYDKLKTISLNIERLVRPRASACAAPYTCMRTRP